MYNKYLILLSIGFFAFSSTVHACVFGTSVEEKIEQSDFIFSGYIRDTVCEDTKKQAIFLVHNIWKGEKDNKIILNFQECSIIEDNYYFINRTNNLRTNFEIGTEYLIYAKLDVKKNEYYALGNYNNCTIDIQKISSSIGDWFRYNYEFFKVYGKPNLFAHVSGANDDLKLLGTPKYKVKN